MSGGQGRRRHDASAWRTTRSWPCDISDTTALDVTVQAQIMEVLERMQGLLPQRFHIDHTPLQRKPMVRILHPMPFEGAPPWEGNHRH